MDWVAWDSHGLAGALRVFDPEGVLTWERSWTSTGGGLELGDSPEAKSQSSLVEKGDPKRSGLSAWSGAILLVGEAQLLLGLGSKMMFSMPP